MRKVLIAILFASVAFGSIWGRSWAQQQPPSETERRQLILKGAKLWPVYCNQCHNARPPSEKAPYEWDIEMMHMQSLGNIPADDLRVILEYLKAR